MADDLLIALQTATAWLGDHGYRYAVVGGIANQLWGLPRFTHDVDIKVLVPNTEYPAIRESLRAAFPERGRPARPPQPLIVDVKIAGVTVDFLLTIPGYDEQTVTRAVQRDIDGVTVYLCTAEDLIIQKAVAGRPKDWQDIEGVLIEQRSNLDLPYLEDWLGRFAEFLERPEILERYREIQARIAEMWKEPETGPA